MPLEAKTTQLGLDGRWGLEELSDTTKDYIQLSKKTEFLKGLTRLFPVAVGGVGSVPLTYQWPAGTAPGSLVFNSADRPHLKWETSMGAPQAWKMSLKPSEATAETIPGNPSHLDFANAENELGLLSGRGAGQPYLMAIKVRAEPRTLHLRAYLSNPSMDFAWADLRLVPQEIQTLAGKTSQQSALAWSFFQSGGIALSSKVETALTQLVMSENQAAAIDVLDMDTGRALTSYLRLPGHGLFFDAARNHEAWLHAAQHSASAMASTDDFAKLLEERFLAVPQGDAAAEELETDPDEVNTFRKKIKRKSYDVADSTATIKTRGSAQKVFAVAVKGNYKYRCAITGIVTKDFLVASHIVPWSEDQSIRLDPSNGICLSLLVDRAFEKGHLLIEDDLTVRVDRGRIGDDQALWRQLAPYDGCKLKAPAKLAPLQKYLQRRRALVSPTD